MTGPDFPRSIVETIAKRAANICSNPDCNTLTTGPSDEEAKALVIGEAAHIYGARQSSPRFRDNMSDTERGDITNAIWLCRNCHKIVDADPNRHPAEVLFEWRNLHENDVTARLGKPSERILQRVIADQLAEFGSLSRLAQQIVIDKPAYWEYKLTLELFRSRLFPVLERWKALTNKLYSRPIHVIPEGEIISWIEARNADQVNFAAAFDTLINGELPASWGPSGQPGDPRRIVRACDFFVELAENVLSWEETVRFCSVPSDYRELRELFVGCGSTYFDSLAQVLESLSKIFDQDRPSGYHHVHLVLDLPENWSQRFKEATDRIIRKKSGRFG